MDIPKSFQLHGQTIDVVYDKQLTNGTDARGMSRFRENRIQLQPSTDSVPTPATMQEQTFCHELIHYLLFHAESKLNEDEKFVNLMGNLLHQALSTMEYPSKSKKK